MLTCTRVSSPLLAFHSSPELPTMLLCSHHLLFRSTAPFSLHQSHSLLFPRRNHSHLQPNAIPEPEQDELSPTSAAALAASIRRASTSSPVEFVMEKTGNHDKAGRSMPSSDFQRLCIEQLQLFRMVVTADAILSVYVRPAGSYIMDQLELRRIALFPEIDVSETSESIILVANFSVVAGLRLAEAALSKQEMDYVNEYGAVIIPLVKHPFIVGFLVAELPKFETEPCLNPEKNWGIQNLKEDLMNPYGQFNIEQRTRAIKISQSLATAYVMDQKALLVQQTSWQNNVRMSRLIEQIRGPLSSIKSLTKMLSMYVKRNEIPYDIIEGIHIQGDHMKDTLQQIQEAVYLTKANIVRYNEDTMKKITSGSSNPSSTPFLPNLTSNDSNSNSLIKFDFDKKDIELPMPPLFLVPLQQNNTRPCDVSEILQDLVEAAIPLAYKQKRILELSCKSNEILRVSVEESALRQALSNLIEGALLRTRVNGRVQIYAGGAPAGGALVVIDDDGPDMQYMTQMHSLAPFGTELLGEGMVDDNMAWNFIAGLTIARELLESFGCFVRVISPRKVDAGFGTGGTRIEIWLPSLSLQSDSTTGEDSQSA